MKQSNYPTALKTAQSKDKTAIRHAADGHQCFKAVAARAKRKMDAAEIRRLDKAHNLHSWSVQSVLDPMVFDRSAGVYFWDSDGKQYLDFSSQLMNLNLGHQHPKVVRVIQEQATKVCYCAPDMAYESRSALVVQSDESAS